MKQERIDASQLELKRLLKFRKRSAKEKRMLQST